jgi:hypothetical protein
LTQKFLGTVGFTQNMGWNMQYILIEEEHDNLVPKGDYEALKEAHLILWKVFCQVAKPSCRGNELGGCRCLSDLFSVSFTDD